MTTETTAAVASRPKAAMLLLTGACAAYLLLTGLDAKSAAVLSGSASSFGLKELALDALLCAGFGFTVWGLRRGLTPARPFAYLFAGAALWRGVDVLVDAGLAVSTDDIAYWRTGQLATAALLVLAATLAGVAAIVLTRRR